MPAPSTPQTIPDVTEDIETGSSSGSGLGRSRDNGLFDQMRVNDAVYFCFGSRTAIGHERKFGTEIRHKAAFSSVALLARKPTRSTFLEVGLDARLL